jgi:hypothetical protein
VKNKVMTLSDVNKNLLLSWGKFTVNKKNKPTKLSKLELPGNGLPSSMTACQYWDLLKCLPIALGNNVSHTNPNWQFLLHLSHLVDL